MAKAAQKTKETAAEAVKTTAAQSKAMNDMPTTSARIRYLNDEGYTRSQIAKILGKRYQHVRNVLVTPVAKQRS